MAVTGTHQFATGISTGYQQGGPVPDDEDDTDTVSPTAPAAAPAIPSGYAAAAPMVQPPAPSAPASDPDAGEEDQEQPQQPQQPRAKAPAKMRALKMKKMRGGKRGRRRVTGFQQGGEVGSSDPFTDWANQVSAMGRPAQKLSPQQGGYLNAADEAAANDWGGGTFTDPQTGEVYDLGRTYAGTTTGPSWPSRPRSYQDGGSVGDQSNYSNYAGLMSARAAPSVWADGGYVRGYQVGGPVTDDETDPNYYPGQDVAYSPQDDQSDQQVGFRDTAGTGASRADVRRARGEEPPQRFKEAVESGLQAVGSGLQKLDLSSYLDQPQRGAGSTDEAGFQQTDFSDADHVRNAHQNLLDWYSSPDHPTGLQGMLQGDGAMNPDEMSARLNAYSDANPDHGHNEAIQGSIADAMRNGDIAGAASMLQNARQTYDGIRAIGTHALENNNPEGVKAAVEAAHNHVPDDTKLTVTPQQGGNYNFHLRDSNGQAATYNLSPDQVWQYTHGLAGQFDHVMSNGVHQNLQTLTQQGAPAAAQTGYQGAPAQQVLPASTPVRNPAATIATDAAGNLTHVRRDDGSWQRVASGAPQQTAAPTGPGTIQTKTPSGVPLGIPLVRDQAGQVVGARTTEGASAQRVLPQGQQAQPQFTREEMESGIAQREEGQGQQSPYQQTYAYPNYQPTPKGGVGAGFVQRMPGANAEAYELLGPGGERAPTGDIRSPRQKALDDYKNQLRATGEPTRPLPQVPANLTEQQSADLEMQMAKQGYSADEYRAALRQSGVPTQTNIPYQPAHIGYGGATAIPPSELKAYNPQTGNYDRPVTDQAQLARTADTAAAARQAATPRQIAPPGAYVPSELTGKARVEALKTDTDRYKEEVAAAAPAKATGKQQNLTATEAQTLTAAERYRSAGQKVPEALAAEEADIYRDMRARRTGRTPSATAAAPTVGGGAPVRVSSPADARKLPSGTRIILPDGSPGVVP